MSKNFLAKVKHEAYNQGYRDGWNQGVETGSQFMADIYESCLNESAVMGKDVFGFKRMMKIHGAAEAMYDEYTPCMWGVTDPEADVWQAKLDGKLKKIWGELFQPFPKRYPHLVECSYERRKK